MLTHDVMVTLITLGRVHQQEWTHDLKTSKSEDLVLVVSLQEVMWSGQANQHPSTRLFSQRKDRSQFW